MVKSVQEQIQVLHMSEHMRLDEGPEVDDRIDSAVQGGEHEL